MKFPCLFNQCSIGQRLIMLTSASILLIITLIVIYSVQVVTLERKLVSMERVDDVFSQILELRRYEKNILLQLDSKSVSRATEVMGRLSRDMNTLAETIRDDDLRVQLSRLQEEFSRYRTIFNRWCRDNRCVVSDPMRQEESRQIREHGHRLVEYASKFASTNRKIVSMDFKEILFWLTFMPAVLLLAGSLLFFSQTRNILNRLSSLQRATKKLAAGEFRPIPLHETPDEITDLISNFNEMARALEENQEQLIQSKKMASIGTFSSGIAHEINNPLNNISLSADTLLEEFEDMDREEIREILEDIMEQTERASNIVRNLLDFSRVQASEMEPMYLDFVLHKTTDLIANELRIHKIALSKEFPEKVPRIRGDLQKLQQVFLNLIINAEQAIGEYGTITVRIEETGDGYIRTDIIDTGPGISQEHIDQIFDPFFTTKEAGKGTGLGLAIVYGIVKKHGGYIEVSSKMGEGTTFSVYLPVLDGQEEQDDSEGVS